MAYIVPVFSRHSDNISNTPTLDLDTWHGKIIALILLSPAIWFFLVMYKCIFDLYLEERRQKKLDKLNQLLKG